MENKKLKGISISNDETYERKKLADLLPLDTPLGVDFHPSTYCNIKCIFCMHSSSNPCYDEIKNQNMNIDTFKKAIDGMKNFPNKIKAVHFCGLGEPLLNKNLPEMIKHAKDAGIAEKLDMNSNGILFTKENTDKICNAGLDFIRISVNGLSKEDFKKNTSVEVDFDKYVQNLTYLYEKCENTKIYIKILDFMVNTKEKKDFFFSTFEPICDNINIENYNECFLDTKGKDELKNSNLSQRGEVLGTQNLCSQPFFKMEILPNGNVAPCAEARSPIIVGNVNKKPINEIWDSKLFNNFRLRMTKGVEFASKICAECTFIKLCNFSSDNIDSEAKRLEEYFQKRV